MYTYSICIYMYMCIYLYPPKWAVMQLPMTPSPRKGPHAHGLGLAYSWHAHCRIPVRLVSWPTPFHIRSVVHRHIHVPLVGWPTPCHIFSIVHCRMRGRLFGWPTLQVVRLCRVTGYNRAEPAKRPRGYPDEYFARFQFPEQVPPTAPPLLPPLCRPLPIPSYRAASAPIAPRSLRQRHCTRQRCQPLAEPLPRHSIILSDPMKTRFNTT